MTPETRAAYYTNTETRLRDHLIAPTLPQRLAMFYEGHIGEMALACFAGGILLTLGVSLNQPEMAAIGGSILAVDIAVTAPTGICYLAETT